VSLRTIKDGAKELTSGLMGKNTRDSSSRTKSTVKAFTPSLMVWLKEVALKTIF